MQIEWFLWHIAEFDFYPMLRKSRIFSWLPRMAATWLSHGLCLLITTYLVRFPLEMNASTEHQTFFIFARKFQSKLLENASILLSLSALDMLAGATWTWDEILAFSSLKLSRLDPWSWIIDAEWASRAIKRLSNMAITTRFIWLWSSSILSFSSSSFSFPFSIRANLPAASASSCK